MTDIRSLAGVVRDMRGDVDSFLDKWNRLGVFIILLLGGFTLWPVVNRGSLLTDRLLVLLTAVYVLTSFNQMRESRKSRRQYEARPVQPDLAYDEAWGSRVPLLRNFGSSPAISFQLLARVETPNQSPKEIKRIERIDEPVNLEPREAVTLMSDELCAILDAPDEWPDGSELSMYYGFESVHSGESPHASGTRTQLDDLVKEYPNPRAFELEELRGCIGQSDV